MAQKRMFSKDVVRTDRFLDMSLSAQALYFHLCLDADVKGFVSPRLVMRMISSTPDDLNVLITKGFAIPFESGVIVITHWNINNKVRESHEAPSQFITEQQRLITTKQGLYQLQNNYSSTTVELLRRIDKDRIDKDSIDKNIEDADDSASSLEKVTYSSRKDITSDVLKEIAEAYEVTEGFVADCWDSAQNWLDSKGKVYKNYRGFLANWVKRERARYLLKQKEWSKFDANRRRGGVVDARE